MSAVPGLGPRFSLTFLCVVCVTGARDQVHVRLRALPSGSVRRCGGWMSGKSVINVGRVATGDSKGELLQSKKTVSNTTY